MLFMLSSSSTYSSSLVGLTDLDLTTGCGLGQLVTLKPKFKMFGIWDDDGAYLETLFTVFILSSSSEKCTQIQSGMSHSNDGHEQKQYTLHLPHHQ